VTMKALVLAAVAVLVPMAFGQNGARPFLLVDVSGNPYPNGSGTPLPYTPPSMICYTLSAGSILPCNFATGGGGDTITSPNSTLNVGGTATATTLDMNLAHSNTWTAAQTNSTAGALSTPAELLSGAPLTSGGTGTTTRPLYLIEPTGTTSTTWSTAGTYFGINVVSGFTGNIFDYQINGVSGLKLSGGNVLTGGFSNFAGYQTGANCSSAASPAVCAAASAGSVAVAAGTNPTLTVNTTRVTANSQIMLTEDESLGTKLSVTCQTAVVPTSTVITARTAATSFTFQANGTFTTNPICYSYTIIN
jgi:hypothetical protein